MTDANDIPKRIILVCEDCDNLYFIPIGDEPEMCGRCDKPLVRSSVKYTQVTINIYTNFCEKCNRLFKIVYDAPQECALCHSTGRRSIVSEMIP